MSWIPLAAALYASGALVCGFVVLGLLHEDVVDEVDESTVFGVVCWPLAILVILVRGGWKFLRR